VARNLTLRTIGRRGRRWRIDAAGEAADAAGTHAGMGIDPPDASVPARTLSGGNQQKAVIGRWMAIRPPVLLLDEPTRGVDVGSRARIHAAIRDLADGGTAVVFASSELEEVLMLADRVLVMHDGAVVGDMPVQAATEEGIMRLATGGRA
jgi:ribose transport system ATP-binding protein